MTTLEIQRGDNGVVSGLSDMPQIDDAIRDGGGFEGAIVDLFPLETPPSSVRRKARSEAERIQKRLHRGKQPKFH